MPVKNLKVLSLWLAYGAAACPVAAAHHALAFSLSAPQTHGRLTAYFIHDPDVTGPGPVMIDGALGNGDARILRSADKLTAENMSDHSVLIPFGTLLTGGRQDQVVAKAMLLPPHSGALTLETFCVDPFRSLPRDRGNPAAFDSPHLLFPSTHARLSLLAGAIRSRRSDEIRQEGVWWSIDTVRSRLALQTGRTLQPPKMTSPEFPPIAISTEQLQARGKKWTEGLPLTLEDRGLAALVQPLVADFAATATMPRDVVGVSFVVDGIWIGAERFRSHALFEQMWPSLLRSYAIQSLAEAATQPASPPSSAVMTSLLEIASEKGVASDKGMGSDTATAWTLGDMRIRENATVVLASVVDQNGIAIQTTHVPKADPALAAWTPEAVLIDTLETGRVGDLPIESLASAPILTSNSAHDRWRVDDDRTPITFLETALDLCLAAFWLYVLACITPLTRMAGFCRRAALRLLAQRWPFRWIRSSDCDFDPSTRIFSRRWIGRPM